MTRINETRGGLFVLMAAALWGTTGTAQAFAPAGYDSTVIGTLRLALGGLILLGLALAGKQFAGRGRWPLGATLCGALFTAAYQVFFFWGVAKTGVAAGTIVGIGSAPVAGGILGILFRGERPGRRWYIATALAITGCALLGTASGEVSVDPVGILLAVGAGVSYAAYTLSIKGLLEKHPPDAVMAVVFCLGALFLLPLLWGRNIGWVLEPRGWIVVLHLGLVTAGIAYWFFARGLQKVNVGTAVTLSLAEPLTAGLLGVLLLQERLSAQAWMGIGLLLGGLMVLTFGGKNLPEEASESARPVV